jgi:hypothetical protein
VNARTRIGLAALGLAAAALALLAAVPSARNALLRSAGAVLVNDDPVEAADVIVIAVDARGAGVLEAVDLVHRGIGTRVAVFSDPPKRVQLELKRRGVEYYDPTAMEIRQLTALGVSRAERVPGTVAGTEDEGSLLPQWCDENHFATVIFISNPDHSRRTRRVLHRDMAGHHTRVLVRASRYGEFDPESWWMTRDGVRTELIEMEKLLIDVLRHPLS